MRSNPGARRISDLLSAAFGHIHGQLNSKSAMASVMMLVLTLPRGGAQEPEMKPSATPSLQIVVNVLGEVNRPSRIVLPKGGTILDAIAAAGGLTKLGNPAKTILIHKSAGEKPDSTKLDLRPILSGAAKDITLRDGDTVVVGQALF